MAVWWMKTRRWKKVKELAHVEEQEKIKNELKVFVTIVIM